jgi:signal transduction histidine kinase
MQSTREFSACTGTFVKVWWDTNPPRRDSRLVAGNADSIHIMWPGRLFARWVRIIIAGLLGIHVAVLAPSALAANTNLVLILDQEGGGRPARYAFLSGLRQALAKNLSGEYELSAEHLDTALYDQPSYRQSFATLLNAKYRGRKLAAIIALDPNSLDYMLEVRPGLWPEAPIIFTGIDEAEARRWAGQKNLTGVTIDIDLGSTLEAAIRLCPDARRIALVSSDQGSPFVHQELQAQAKRFASTGFECIQLRGLTLAETKHRVATLPSQTLILYHSVRFEGGYQVLAQRDALAELSFVSRSPIFSCEDIFIGFGTVGGSCKIYSRLGGEVAQRVVLAVRAGTAQGIPVARSVQHRLIFDWREMQRWGLDDSRLPPGSEVRFRPPGLWEGHREAVVITLVALVLQTGLVIALLVQRFRAVQTRRALREHREQLAHAGRVSALGQLASALTHELNQPLGAIRRNVEAAELFLQRDPPDYAEVRAIVADIFKDNLRAGEVIDRMRVLIKRRSPESNPLALGEIAKEAVGFIRSAAAVHKIDCELEIPSDLPLVQGDLVQVQQVLLNLMLNAMDAMNDIPLHDRRLLVSARLAEMGEVEVAVSDSGAGIPSDKLPRLFEPFFTTKPSGMGLGLAISRTIVETLGGRIWAENRPCGGACFRFTLPIFRNSATR